MRYGIYGGAFDPFHRGHLEVIKGVMASCQLTELFVVPTGQPVFKANRTLTPAAYRYYMLQAVLRSMPNVVVSDIEIQSEEKSYTLHTIDRLVDVIISPKTVRYIGFAVRIFSMNLKDGINRKRLLVK